MVGMTATVEDFSTYGKHEWRDRLNCQSMRNGASYSPMDASRHKQEVGQRLRLAREALGLTQQAFAEKLGERDKTKISHWERGKHYPDPLFIAALQRQFRISSDWLYSGDDALLPVGVADSLRAAEAASKGA